MEELIGRVEALQASVTRLRRVCVMLCVLCVVAALSCGRAVRAESEVEVSHRYVVTDRSGKTRAMFGCFLDGNAALQLMDASGQVRAGMTVSSTGRTVMRLDDVVGRQRATIIIEADGKPSIDLYNTEGRSIWKAP
jgi:hypothetical protein